MILRKDLGQQGIAQGGKSRAEKGAEEKGIESDVPIVGRAGRGHLRTRTRRTLTMVSDHPSVR